MPTQHTPKHKWPTPEQDLAELAIHLHERVKVCNSRIRVEILGLLLGGPMDVTTLTHRLALEMPAISHHLTMLKRDGLVVCQHDRTRHVYSLSLAIRVEERGSNVEMRISTGGAGLLIFAMPLELVRRLHPDWGQMAAEEAAAVTVRRVMELASERFASRRVADRHQAKPNGPAPASTETKH